ncbi:MAG: UDP-N-acetylmuramate--L-alanine ligase [Candidatus Falkowbacteria bacterium]|nr:UDP-N-acetylmuramate--L-alanine ligase [Candidatus Falkowbacteria bacterium]
MISISGSKSKTKLNYYFIGLKGVGMTMLAQFLVKTGNRVSGSDIKDVFLTDSVLQQSKIKVLSPFNPKNIPLSSKKGLAKVEVIVHSSAFTPENNVELAYIKNNPARFKNIKILSYAEALGGIFNSYYGLAVCGSHGKTTTAAWLAYVLWRAGFEPNVLVGSSVPQFKNQSSLVGASKYLVAEVDEYQNKLKYFAPQGVILNNIEYDHPDFFKTEASYVKVFADFIRKVPASGFLVANGADKYIQKIKNNCRGTLITYSLRQVQDIKTKNGLTSFTFGRLGEFKIRLLGAHNILNALAVIKTALRLKVPLAQIKKYLAEFKGTARRAQILGKYQEALIIDDYAHHPTEVKATLEALRAVYPKRNIITVFHPHTYTRTKALFKDFVTSFKDTDELIILNIYGSAREKQGGVSSQELVTAINTFNKKQKRDQSIKNLADLKAATKYLRQRLGKNDLLILMGAGEVFRVGENLLRK